ncbi:MAG: efflux RND transporter permease subunit, partial [Proteobacteria bacterium]|nr:efflux RND transporter permease subunit [Pseudomonadota bacterium]
MGKFLDFVAFSYVVDRSCRLKQPRVAGRSVPVGLTRLSLARPVAIVMLFAALIVLGLQSYGRLAVDRLPPTNFPSVSVNVNYAGASPLDIEQLIAIPLEKAVAGLRGVDTVSSNSSLGSVRLNVNFTEDTNLDQAAIDVEK